MAKGKGGGGRKDPPNFNMIGNPERKATTAKEIIAEGRNPGIENPLNRPEKKLDPKTVIAENPPKEQGKFNFSNRLDDKRTKSSSEISQDIQKNQQKSQQMNKDRDIDHDID